MKCLWRLSTILLILGLLGCGLEMDGSKDENSDDSNALQGTVSQLLQMISLPMARAAGNCHSVCNTNYCMNIYQVVDESTENFICSANIAANGSYKILLADLSALDGVILKFEAKHALDSSKNREYIDVYDSDNPQTDYDVNPETTFKAPIHKQAFIDPLYKDNIKEHYQSLKEQYTVDKLRELLVNNTGVSSLDINNTSSLLKYAKVLNQNKVYFNGSLRRTERQLLEKNTIGKYGDICGKTYIGLLASCYIHNETGKLYSPEKTTSSEKEPVKEGEPVLYEKPVLEKVSESGLATPTEKEAVNYTTARKLIIKKLNDKVYSCNSAKLLDPYRAAHDVQYQPLFQELAMVKLVLVVKEKSTTTKLQSTEPICPRGITINYKNPGFASLHTGCEFNSKSHENCCLIDPEQAKKALDALNFSCAIISNINYEK